MLEIVIWDVQHGSAAYINTPEDKHFVIDLGTGSYEDNNEDFSPLMHLKNNYNIDSIDEVIITHPHTDHLDDIFNFDKLSPKILRRPTHLSEEDIRKANPDSDSEIVDKYIKLDNRFSQPVKKSENPSLPENNGGVNFYCFTSSECGTSNINNHSIVTIVEYLDVKVVIPGDNESPSWEELLENDNFVNKIMGRNVFIAPHHGRASGYSSSLFDHIVPYLVIVSDDKETDTSVTDKYSKKASGWKVYSRSDNSSEKRYCLTTRKDGTIVIKIYEEGEDTYLNISKD